MIGIRNTPCAPSEMCFGEVGMMNLASAVIIRRVSFIKRPLSLSHIDALYRPTFQLGAVCARSKFPTHPALLPGGHVARNGLCKAAGSQVANPGVFRL